MTPQKFSAKHARATLERLKTEREAIRQRIAAEQEKFSRIDEAIVHLSNWLGEPAAELEKKSE